MFSQTSLSQSSKTASFERQYFSFSLYVRHPLKEGWIPSKLSKDLKSSLKKMSLISLTGPNKLFANIYQSMDRVKDQNKSLNLEEIIEALKNQIIPFEYFGSCLNQKLFFRIVDRLVKQTFKECIHVTELYENYEYDQILWLKTRDEKRQKEVLKSMNIMLIQTVVKPFIRFYYVFYTNCKNRTMLCVPRQQFYKFNSTCMNHLLESGHIETAKATNMFPKGRIKFIPKNIDLDPPEFRPILMINQKTEKFMVTSMKRKLTQLVGKLKDDRKLSWQGLDIYEKWRLFTKCEEGKKLFVIKLDIQDAFGNTDLNQLWEIIKNTDDILSGTDKTFLYRYIFNQHVKVSGAGRKVFPWKHGLLQGDRLSSVLCELYLTDLENKKMMAFLKAPHSLFHRTIDDIIFVTTFGSRIFHFESCASQIYILNERKTVKYFDVDDNPCIPYLGKLFNVKTREISYFYDFEKEPQLRGKFKIWNMKKQISKDSIAWFIRSSMGFSALNHLFSRHLLNSSINSPERIVKNIFEGMCLVAFKLHYILKTVYYAFNAEQPFADTVLKIVGNILMAYSKIIYETIQKNKGEKYKDTLGTRLIRWVTLRAFVLVFKRKNVTYLGVIPKLRETIHNYYINLKRAELDINSKYFVTLPDVFKNLK